MNKKSANNSVVATVTQEKEDVYHWMDAMLQGVARGLQLRKLQPEMLNDEGVTIEVGNGVSVLFDKEFVLFYLMEKALKPLGLINKDGKVKQKYLYETFLPELITYVENVAERETQQALRDLASRMSKFNGLSIEENIERILEKDNTLE